MLEMRWVDYFLSVLKSTAELSTCQSKQVGALLVKDNRIIAQGYNGVCTGQQHCNSMKFDSRKWHHDWSLLNELHAEQNIIGFCAKNGIRTEDCTLFVTLSPCIDCAKLIVASKIKDIYFTEQYDMNDGVNFLVKNGFTFRTKGKIFSYLSRT